MDKMKMLNDEELENVVGGASRTYYSLTSAGKVKVNPDYFCCQNLSYFEGSAFLTAGKTVCCNCIYRDGYYCTNPNFIAQLTNG